jgi:FemAB family protein
MYKEIVKKKFSEFKEFDYKFRHEAKDVWDRFLNQLAISPVVYTNQELDYQELYRVETNFIDIDLSLIGYSNKEPVVVFPFSICSKDNILQLSSYGLPVLAPLFKDDLTNKIKEKLSLIFYEILQNIALNYKIETWTSAESFSNNFHKSFWNKISTKMGDKIHEINEGYIDLTKSLEEISRYHKKKNVHRNIKIASTLWTVETKNKVNFKEWDEFKNLHIKVSGKQTRSNKTWKSQLEDINNNKAIAIFLYNLDKLIGGAMFRFSNTTALYATGAFDRELFPKPVSHLAFFIAIKELKQKNIKWLKMGDIPNTSDYNNPSNKEISIGIFKKRFSTDVFVKNIIIHKKW